MTRSGIICVAALCALSCTAEVIETSAGEQASTLLQSRQQQGTQLQGTQLQGTQLQGMTMQGFQVAEATLGGVALVNLRIEGGEVVAEQDRVTLRGTSLIGAHLYAQVENLEVDPPVTALVEYRIANIIAEDPKYDPTYTGSTFLYTLEQNVDHTDAWQPACPVDFDGRRVAIPIAATWNAHGDRVESSSQFTFGCTTGVIAKCYRWGYRPWLTAYGDLAAMHWACTRLARADYCGDGVPHTRDGTWVNVWDDLDAPGPIESHGLHVLAGMSFEAGWNTEGAECLSRTRWKADMKLIVRTCPDRRMKSDRVKKFCDNVEDAREHGLEVLLFNESYDDPLHHH
jgi:ADYC domain-containing protein